MKTKDPALYVVLSIQCLKELQDWLGEREYNRSVYGGKLRDKRGKPMIGLSMDQDRRGLIVVQSDELFGEAVRIVVLHQHVERAA